MKKSKTSNKKEQFSLRMKLLWIWFLKNLWLIANIILIVVIVLVATNAIGSNTFINYIIKLFNNGENIDPIELGSGTRAIINIFALVVTLLASTPVAMKKVKHLAIGDIKSRNLKIALIKAKLYFDENGKLCKRPTEELEDIDMDESEKIGQKNVKNGSTNILSGVVTAASELKTVLTTDLSETEETIVEDEQLHDDVVEIEETSIGLEDTTNDVELGQANLEDSDAEITNTVSVKKKKERKPNIFSKGWNTTKVFVKSFWNNFVLAIKSMKDPKLDDGMNTKKVKIKKEKHKKNKEINTVEFVNTENTDTNLISEEEITADISNESEKNEVINDPVLDSEEKEVVSDPEPVYERKSSKQRQIDDILNDMR